MRVKVILLHFKCVSLLIRTPTVIIPTINLIVNSLALGIVFPIV